MKSVLFLVLVIFLFCACSEKHNAEIRGQIFDGGNKKMYLDQLNVEKKVTIDSLTTDGDGSFHFKFNITDPCFYGLRMGNESITLFMFPGEEIDFRSWNKGYHQRYVLIGSEASEHIRTLNNELRKTVVLMDSLKKDFNSLPNEKRFDSQREDLSSQWDSAYFKQVQFSREFILANALSPAAYYALYQKFDKDSYVVDPIRDSYSFRIVASAMKAMYPESQFTKALLNHYKEINKNIRTQNIKTLIDVSENQLPEIRLPDSKGDTISFSSLKGKYILLDFTLLGAQESRQHIKELQQIYHKFRSKGFVIYQVCLDKNRLLWEDLVAQYNITWPCVWDSDGAESRAAAKWNIREIPANYLINKDWEIAGKDLSGRRLEDRLNDIIKK